MKCIKCGYEFDEGIFCPECGTKYDEGEALRIEEEKKKREQEINEKKAEEEKKHQEQLTRTFNGVVYSSVDERNAAEAAYYNEVANAKAQKKANTLSIWSMILGIATFPLTFTLIFWFPALIISIVFGVVALKSNTTKRGFAITGFIFSGLYIAIIILGFVLG